MIEGTQNSESVADREPWKFVRLAQEALTATDLAADAEARDEISNDDV